MGCAELLSGDGGGGIGGVGSVGSDGGGGSFVGCDDDDLGVGSVSGDVSIGSVVVGDGGGLVVGNDGLVGGVIGGASDICLMTSWAWFAFQDAFIPREHFKGSRAFL